jgi:hypothetical protein
VSQLVPDDGPPRLIRFVAQEDVRNHNVIAELDRDQNILFVVRDRFDAMTKEEQNRILKTSKRVTSAEVTDEVFA